MLRDDAALDQSHRTSLLAQGVANPSLGMVDTTNTTGVSTHQMGVDHMPHIDASHFIGYTGPQPNGYSPTSQQQSGFTFSATPSVGSPNTGSLSPVSPELPNTSAQSGFGGAFYTRRS